MSTYTKGPWIIGRVDPARDHDGWIDDGGYRIDANGVEQLAYVWCLSDRINPATMSQDGTSPFGARAAEANANLIAAAPDMHAALLNAMEFIEREYRDDRYEPEGEWLPPEARKLFSQIVDAVCKAEGLS